MQNAVESFPADLVLKKMGKIYEELQDHIARIEMACDEALKELQPKPRDV